MQSQLPDSQVASAPLNTTSKTSRISTSFFSKLDVYYDLPLAYIIVIILCYLYTLIAIVKAVAHEFKDRLVEGEGQFYQYCNLVFGGWDFCIHNEKSAQIKYKVIIGQGAFLLCGIWLIRGFVLDFWIF